MATPQPLQIDPAWLPPGVELPKHPVVRFSGPERRVMRKKRPMPCSQWAERHRVVPSDSAVPGTWKNATTPYLAGIMDASWFESVQQITICAPPQCGKSDCVNNCIGYAADRRPGNVLAVYPDEMTARENNRDRIVPMFQDSSRLRAYLTGAEDDLASLRIRLQHMKIYMAWANSAARLGNKPLPYVVCDEVDKYPATAGKKEAAPIDLAKKRTRTFSHMRKIWLTSTPTTEDGPIWQALENEAEVVFVFWVRCPDCHAAQQMVFKQIRWDGGGEADPREIETKRLAWYECEHCGSRWDDARRNAAVRAGEWRDRDRGLALETCLQAMRPRHIGFHLRAYVSPFVSLSESAAAFLWGLRDKTKLKDFQNAHEAEPWRVCEQMRDEARILELRDGRPSGRVPGGGIIAGLTAGVDTQDDGYWFIVVAWPWAGKDLIKEGHVVRMGFVAEDGGLARVLWDDAYLDPDGTRYVPVLTVQDSAGHRTSDVYQFCRKHPGKIVPSIGRDTMAQPYTWGNVEYWPGTKKPIPGGLKLLNINTKFFKDDLARRLEILPGDPGGIRFPGPAPGASLPADAPVDGLTMDLARHFTSEYIDERGLWACPSHKPNHLWDCLVMASCAYEVVGMRHWAPPETKAVPVDERRKDPRKWVDPPKRRWV
jgi:phage terminase large subunit GpA-like protein